jgi:hypothetical protein
MDVEMSNSNQNPRFTYITGGTMPPNAPSYVERKADYDLLAALLAGEYCYLLDTRQMGKSSLMVRTGVRLRDHGVDTVVLDLSAIGQNVTPDRWYAGLLARLGEQFNIEDKLIAHWH